jgi:hypothetical protein
MQRIRRQIGIFGERSARKPLYANVTIAKGRTPGFAGAAVEV